MRHRRDGVVHIAGKFIDTAGRTPLGGSPGMALRGISSPIAVARWKTGSEMTLTDEPAVSQGCVPSYRRCAK
jgi:hypothetical protein